MEKRVSERQFFLLIAAVGGLALLSSTMSKTPVLPLFAAHLGSTPFEIGWIVIASTIPGILISFPAGAIADAFGKRRVIIASLVVFATAPFLYLLVAEAWQLMTVRETDPSARPRRRTTRVCPVSENPQANCESSTPSCGMRPVADLQKPGMSR